MMNRPKADDVIAQGARMRTLQQHYFSLRRRRNRGDDIPEAEIRAALRDAQDGERAFDRLVEEYQSPQTLLFEEKE